MPSPPRMGEEGTGDSSSPPCLQPHLQDLQLKRHSIYERLLFLGKAAPEDPSSFRDKLYLHFDKLPARYLIDLDVHRAEDVLLHRRILDECAHPDKRPLFHARFLKYLPVERDPEFDLRSLDLSPERGRNAAADNTGSISSRVSNSILLHEIIFSSLDRPKLLSRLTALLSEVGLNIREAHVYSTTDGFCLDVFLVDGWATEETDDLLKKIKETLTHKNASPSSSTNSLASEKLLELQQQVADSEIDWSLLTMGEMIASGSSADLYRGTYNGFDVAIKMLRIAHFNSPSEVEFLQEVLILRSVNHENILHFYGACIRHPHYCIVTEYIPGGNLYDFLHKQNNVLDLLTILAITISISKGMDYLHRNNIIHRDLKTANLLIGYDQVVKIADFGVARLGSQEEQMTAETGTYRWMAPEIINHKPYDHKADVFSFAIVLWELATSKVPYDNMTPLQAALGVRQGYRLEIPKSVDPRLSKLIERCWDEDPDARPIFAEIVIQLEDILQHVGAPKGGHQSSRAKMQKKSQT